MQTIVHHEVSNNIFEHYSAVVYFPLINEAGRLCYLSCNSCHLRGVHSVALLFRITLESPECLSDPKVRHRVDFALRLMSHWSVKLGPICLLTRDVYGYLA